MSKNDIENPLVNPSIGKLQGLRSTAAMLDDGLFDHPKEDVVDPLEQCVSRLSDLIINMLAKDATDDEIKRVIKHSMAALDYERSYENNGIAEIEAKYQNS